MRRLCLALLCVPAAGVLPAPAAASVPHTVMPGETLWSIAAANGFTTRALAAANGRFPANTTAGKQVNDPLLKQFGKAGVGGVPMPNIPQMGSVWSELGGAWVKSTQGAGATKARIAFTTAARNIANKIG